MTSVPNPPSRNWTELPPELTASILSRLGIVDILMVAQHVCSAWRKVCNDPFMWRSIDMRYLDDERDPELNLANICRLAVQRSLGGLLEISIEYFGTDDLLWDIVSGSSQLKCLRLVSCYDITDEGLIAIAAKIPCLEELEICCYPPSKEVYITYGHSCPNLRTFKLICRGYRRRPNIIEADKEALAIAENMPELRYLQLFGNKLTNDGLQAILDGCPHLEFLDLRQCFNVKLDGPFGKRCAEHIKELRGPYDTTLDYPFDAHWLEMDSGEEDDPYGLSDIDYLSNDDEEDYEFSDDLDDFGDFDELDMDLII